MTTNNDPHSRSRAPKGIPAGGQFAAEAKTEPALGLSDPGQTALADKPVLDLGGFADPGVSDDIWQAASCIGYGVSTRDELKHVLASTFTNLDDAECDRYAAELAELAEQRDFPALSDPIDRAYTTHLRRSSNAVDPNYHPPGATVRDSPFGYQSPEVTGGKYTGFLPAAQVAKNVRGDLKEAQKANWIPANLTFSVRSARFAGGQAVDVEIRGVPDSEHFVDDHTMDGTYQVRSSAARELERRVESIANAYNQDSSDSMQDFVHNAYFCNVRIESDHSRRFREAMAEKRRVARYS